MIIKKVVIKAPPSLQGDLYNRIKILPLVEGITARNLVSKHFQEIAALDDLYNFEYSAKKSLGRRYCRLKTSIGTSTREPLKQIKRWKKILIAQEKKLRVAKGGKSIFVPASSEKADESDYERISRVIRKSFKGTPEELERKIDLAYSILKYGDAPKQQAAQPKGRGSKEMLKKIRGLILLADGYLNGDISSAGSWESKLDSALKMLFSEGQLHLFISVRECKLSEYEKITVSTNLDKTCGISRESIEAALSESASDSGYSPVFTFDAAGRKNGKLPYLGITAPLTMAHAALGGVAEIAGRVAVKTDFKGGSQSAD